MYVGNTRHRNRRGCLSAYRSVYSTAAWVALVNGFSGNEGGGGERKKGRKRKENIDERRRIRTNKSADRASLAINN